MDEKEKEAIGKAAGMSAGVAGGAMVGTMVSPVPVVGTFVGGVVGGVIGSWVGPPVGRALIEGGEAFLRSIQGSDLIPTPAVAEDAPAAADGTEPANGNGDHGYA